MTMTCHIVTAIPLGAMLSLMLGGCARGGGGEIPQEAALIATEAGAMGFLAPTGGTVYIIDTKTGRVAYTAPVAQGDKLAFMPKQKQVIVNGQTIRMPDLNEKHVHRLYFLKG